MTGCCAPHCTNREEHGKAFFSIPCGKSVSVVRRRLKWLLRMKRQKPAGRGARICEDHFSQDQFEEVLVKGKKRLKPDAIPSIFSFSAPSESPCTAGDIPSESSSNTATEGIKMEVQSDTYNASTPCSDMKSTPIEGIKMEVESDTYNASTPCSDMKSTPIDAKKPEACVASEPQLSVM
ncbi:THAP domain-containing protein 7-like [Rhipicephalus sanguineus]|uniref:THAP domain-containing protein 7-like n=1 Tax=Rhipicephalus sanguineus TaxID=34632 RepID=UPI0020C1C682|nr:THAP domain-containing protein 7-like [Rhipicephalus sanguineus]